MYNILPTDKVEMMPAQKRAAQEKVDSFVRGEPTKPLGLFQFLLLLAILLPWVSFTGLAILLKRDLPTQWFSLVEGLLGEDGLDRITTILPEKVFAKPAKVRIEKINSKFRQ